MEQQRSALAKNGVEGKIRKHYKNITYVHCSSHVLALALAAGCQQVTEIQNMFHNVGKLTWLLGGRAKRNAILEYDSAASKENDDLNEQQLQTDDDMLNESDIAIKQESYKKSVPKFCATRWTARVDTLSALIAKYKLILEALEQIQDTSNGDARRYAGTYIRLLSDSAFLVSLVVAQFILSYCSCVTKSLLAVNCDLGKAYKYVRVSKEPIVNERDETTWNKVWGRIESIKEGVYRYNYHETKNCHHTTPSVKCRS